MSEIGDHVTPFHIDPLDKAQITTNLPTTEGAGTDEAATLPEADLPDDVAAAAQEIQKALDNATKRSQ